MVLQQVCKRVLHQSSKIRKKLGERKAIEDPLKPNIHYGNQVVRKLMPKEYVDSYGVTNLFRVELSGFWRMLYKLTNDETEVVIIAFVLGIIEHKEYDRKFWYKS